MDEGRSTAADDGSEAEPTPQELTPGQMWGCAGVAILMLGLVIGLIVWGIMALQGEPVAEAEDPATIMDVDVARICRQELRNRVPAFDYPPLQDTQSYDPATQLWTGIGPVESNGEYRATYTCILDATPYSDGQIKYRVVMLESPGVRIP